jgi:hypothetical protein
MVCPSGLGLLVQHFPKSLSIRGCIINPSCCHPLQPALGLAAARAGRRRFPRAPTRTAAARSSPSPPRPSPSSDEHRLRGHGEFGAVRASTKTLVMEILGIKVGCISPVSHLFELVLRWWPKWGVRRASFCGPLCLRDVLPAAGEGVLGRPQGGVHGDRRGRPCRLPPQA